MHGVQIGAFTLPISETFTNKNNLQSQISTADITEDMLDKSDAPDKGENESCDEDKKSQDSTEHNPMDLSDEDDEDAELYAEQNDNNFHPFAMEGLGADYAAAM